MTRLRGALRLPWLRRRRRADDRPGEMHDFHLPVDPRHVLDGPLDPELERIRAGLRPHQRRLWMRRIVRRAWIVVAAVAIAELALWTAARVAPLEAAPAFGASLPLLGVAALAVAAIRARPTIGETAIAVDREAGIGDRVGSALALAVTVPTAAGPATEAELAALTSDAPAPDQETEERRFVRKQRRDALGSLRLVRSDLFRPRLSRRPAAIAVIALLVLAPVVLVPNSQDAVIAQARAVREEANAQAEKLDRLAGDLEEKGTSPDDPRTRLAEELRNLARQLRENPDALDANLAKLGAVEAALRSRLNPANEQRAAALTTLSRGLSRTATGNERANPEGDPEKAAEDLTDLGDKLDDMTDAEKQALARELTELQSSASQAGGAAGQALRDAAQSLAQGDTTGAKEALNRLSEALGDTTDAVATNRDLTGAANQLQDSRRDLADAGRAGPGGQTGQGGQPGSSGNPGGGGQGGQPGSSGSPGSGGQGGQPGSSGNPGSGGQGGQGQGGQGGQGQGGQGQGGGSIGGGGSNANYLGSGTGGNSRVGGPVNPNRPSQLGEDISSIFAPFDRLGRPGDPSYIAGTGGSGQTTQGNQQGAGTDPGSYVPYSQVFSQFYQYALATLDRGYVPLSVKDYVRDYFSSLDPTE